MLLRVQVRDKECCFMVMMWVFLEKEYDEIKCLYITTCFVSNVVVVFFIVFVLCSLANVVILLLHDDDDCLCFGSNNCCPQLKTLLVFSRQCTQ